MKLILFLTLITIFFFWNFAPQKSFGHGPDQKRREANWRSSVIEDPSISAKCKRLIKERKEKIEMRQKINGLIIRNLRIQAKLPPYKKRLKEKLVINLKRLKREKELMLLKLRIMTETVIKKGCPGINL